MCILTVCINIVTKKGKNKNQIIKKKNPKQKQKQKNKQTNIIKSRNFIKLFLMQFTMYLFKDEDCYFCRFDGRRVDAC